VVDANTSPDEKLKKNTRSWVYPVEEFISRPQTMRARYALTSVFDFLPLAVAGAVFLGLFYMLYKVLMGKEAEEAE
jgi:hypothetical protein